MDSSRSTERPVRRVFVVTGPSGAGKGTLIRALLARVPELELSISATTRLRRPGEEDGVHYWFLPEVEFVRRVAGGDFLEHVTFVSGQRYGTLRSEIERINSLGKVPLLELETEGAIRVRDEEADAVTIFIRAPVAELERRLRERATESAGEIGERIDLAGRQLEQAEEFDHVIENDDLPRAVADLENIVRRELDGSGTMARA